mmetsp:Transcript_17315/g.40005  ORF Transcript_17315/g.40005 Transcript_17315/m.40005 type:complete len:339 (+) Transcript_17315:447-1463(+)
MVLLLLYFDVITARAVPCSSSVPSSFFLFFLKKTTSVGIEIRFFFFFFFLFLFSEDSEALLLLLLLDSTSSVMDGLMHAIALLDSPSAMLDGGSGFLHWFVESAHDRDSMVSSSCIFSFLCLSSSPLMSDADWEASRSNKLSVLDLSIGSAGSILVTLVPSSSVMRLSSKDPDLTSSFERRLLSNVPSWLVVRRLLSKVFDLPSFWSENWLSSKVPDGVGSGNIGACSTPFNASPSAETKSCSLLLDVLGVCSSDDCVVTSFSIALSSSPSLFFSAVLFASSDFGVAAMAKNPVAISYHDNSFVGDSALVSVRVSPSSLLSVVSILSFCCCWLGMQGQ